MKTNLNALIASLFALLLLGCASLSQAQSPQPDTYYRFFRGTRLASLTQLQFNDKLGREFIPAAPATHAKNGLVAYLPAVMAAPVASQVADEIALVAYESEDVYKAAAATPEGKAYGDLHWTVFDKARSPRAGSTRFKDGMIPVADQAYDVTGGAPDWQSGYTTLFIGLRKKNASVRDYLPWLSRHVTEVNHAFARHGMRGYVFLATADYEIAFQNWTSEAAMKQAFEDAAAKAIVSDAGKWMDTAYYEGAKPFVGKAIPGQTYNVRFKRR